MGGGRGQLTPLTLRRRLAAVEALVGRGAPRCASCGRPAGLGLAHVWTHQARVYADQLEGPPCRACLRRPSPDGRVTVVVYETPAADPRCGPPPGPLLGSEADVLGARR